MQPVPIPGQVLGAAIEVEEDVLEDGMTIHVAEDLHFLAGDVVKMW